MRISVTLIAVVLLTAPFAAGEPASKPALTDNVLDAKGLDSALEKLNAPMRETDPLPPQESAKRFNLADGLAIDLIAAEPDIRQPLCINFDERGRMWVVQYIQYPFPAGLKVVEYDRYIRAKFDKTPAAPPDHFAGKDVVTILEDVDGDGSFRKHKTFVSGLSIATSALPGRGGRPPKDGKADYGVWVMNAPYLLFYPDADRDDVPDSDPIIHLSGFGLEDTHAVASNLTWGPDGWLYGTQGSTCTAKVKTHLGDTSKTTDFLGQAVWRYHPERHVFEIFAEGGGNTFGLEFDDAGRAFSGTNWGKFRGLHYVQGGYYVKGWGKHGPLTNPYAFGFFDHMPHEGNADRLSHTFVVYGGTLMPQYRGKIISPNSLQSRIQLTRLEPMGSTYKTVEEPYLVTSDDGWFRPVDLKVGPDGAIYVADFYEKRISHVDPRDTWERGSGRIWRIRPADWKPTSVAMDMWTEPAEKLVERLTSANRWERWTARRVLADHHEPAAVEHLRQQLRDTSGQTQLESLLALNVIVGLSETDAKIAMKASTPETRAWAIRLLADIKDEPIPSTLLDALVNEAATATNALVRSHLASAAKRLPAEQAMPVLLKMLLHDADAADPYIPLLIWWAFEDKAVSDFDVVAALKDPTLWKHVLARDLVFPGLSRRYAAEPTNENQMALVRLLDAAPSQRERRLLLIAARSGLMLGGGAVWSDKLIRAFRESGDTELALRAGDRSAVPAALSAAADEKADVFDRRRLIDAVAYASNEESTAEALLRIAVSTRKNDVRSVAISSLTRYAIPEIADGLANLYPKLGKDTDGKTAILSSLMTRPSWAIRLLEAVQANQVPKSDLSPADITRLRQFEDPAVVALVEKVFGKAVHVSDAEKAKEVERITHLATTGIGDADRGKVIFTTRCGVCHKLHTDTGDVGPDLTAYDRRNPTDMAINIVDPSAFIREEFVSFRVKTKGGEAYVGLITERAGDRLTIVDAARQKTTIAKPDIADERALTVSLMPEGLLAGLSDQEIRDLFKYLATP